MIRNWYSVPLWVSEFDSAAQQELAEHANRQTYQQHPEWHSHGLSDPSFSGNPLEHMPETAREICTNTQEYLQALDYDSMDHTVVNSWFTCTHPGEHAHIHDHPGVDISGVVYAAADSTQGDIFFPRPFDQFGMSKLLMHWPDHYSLEPTTGRVILFPSWLKHGVRTNTSNTNRVSFSWNTVLYK